jgi:hypothetical protein
LIDDDIYIVKAYIRKANVLFALREYTKALDALEVAREKDEAVGSKSTREIQELSYKIQSAISTERANETEQETMERAMRDPEVAVRVSHFSLKRVFNFFFHFIDAFITGETGNYDRSRDAEYLAAGAEQPTSTAGPHEESDGAE